MAEEVYINTDIEVFLNLVSAPSDTPTAALYENGEFVYDFEVSVETPVDGYAASYKVGIPGAEYDTSYRILWEWDAKHRNDFYEVVTPYNTPEELAETYGWIYDGSDANKDRDEVVRAERLARFIINTYTNAKSFGKWVGSEVAYGQSSDQLFLDEHIISVSKLAENNSTEIDNTSDPVVADFGYPIEITEDGLAIRVNVDYNINEWETPGRRRGRFKTGSRYKVYGTFGYDYVPMEVKDASAILTNDYMCMDASWRGRYLNKIEIRDWKFNFEKEAYRGTGNLFADQLLSKFRNDGMLVI